MECRLESILIQILDTLHQYVDYVCCLFGSFVIIESFFGILTHEDTCHKHQVLWCCACFETQIKAFLIATKSFEICSYDLKFPRPPLPPLFSAHSQSSRTLTQAIWPNNHAHNLVLTLLKQKENRHNIQTYCANHIKV